MALFFMLMARKNKSRAEELKVMASFLESPSHLMDEFELNPLSGRVTLEGIDFEWGNIATIAKELNVQNLLTNRNALLRLNPKYVCHLDNLNKKQEEYIIDKFKISTDSLSFSKNKADLLVVNNEDKIYYVSVKDDIADSKLGQVCNKEYGKAQLVGGFEGVDLSGFGIPQEIFYEDTYLDESQWAKLNGKKKHKECAYIKKNHPEAWKNIVDNRLEASYQCLEKFSADIGSDRESLAEFLLKTLVGVAADLDNYFLSLGENLIDIHKMLTNFKNLDFKVETEWYQSNTKRQKRSLIIWIVFPDRRYGLTKIEPAFDGGYDLHASQTKGIIYYFQQWPISKKNAPRSSIDLNYKNLLLDISK